MDKDPLEPFEHRHPGVKTYLRALEPNPNLPEDLRIIANSFYDFAIDLVVDIEEDSPWLTNTLHKLWEAKNEAIMAKLNK